MNRNTVSEHISQVQPVVRPAPGGYLAVSEPRSIVRIGVIGADPEDAVQRFKKALEAWARLADAPIPARLTDPDGDR